MTKRTLNAQPSHLRRIAALAIVTGFVALSGCTGESGPVAPSASAPTAATPADKKSDKVPTVPGGKKDLMDGIPKK